MNNPINYYDDDGYNPIVIAPLIKALLAGFAIMAGYLSYKLLNDPAVQRALGDLIRVFGNGIKSLAVGLVEAVSNALSKALNRAPDTARADHHMVARVHPEADPARVVLRSVGIDKNSRINIVSVKKNLHVHLHTTAYFRAVNNIMKPAMGNRHKVEGALAFIRKILTTASNATP